eukprot:993409-Pleurochrysis_carterae.AAC.1
MPRLASCSSAATLCSQQRRATRSSFTTTLPASRSRCSAWFSTAMSSRRRARRRTTASTPSARRQSAACSTATSIVPSARRRRTRSPSAESERRSARMNGSLRAYTQRRPASEARTSFHMQPETSDLPHCTTFLADVRGSAAVHPSPIPADSAVLIGFRPRAAFKRCVFLASTYPAGQFAANFAWASAVRVLALQIHLPCKSSASGGLLETWLAYGTHVEVQSFGAALSAASKGLAI